MFRGQINLIELIKMISLIIQSILIGWNYYPIPPSHKKKKSLPQTHTQVRSISVSCRRNWWLLRLEFFYQNISNICVPQTLCPNDQKGGESPSKLMCALIIPWPSGGKVSEKATLMVCVPLHQEGPTTAWEPEIHHSFSPNTNVFNVYRLYLTGLSARYCTQCCLSDSSHGPILPGLLN